jgi:hypothetical protein
MPNEPLTETPDQSHAATSGVSGTTAVPPGVLPAIPNANIEEPKTEVVPQIPRYRLWNPVPGFRTSV